MLFAAVSCAEGFPSQDYPVLDFTVIHGRFEGAGKVAEMSVWRSEGVAADGIAEVGFGNSAGEVVGTTPVGNNVYRHATVPTGQFIALVALDAAGNVVSSKPLAPQN